MVSPTRPRGFRIEVLHLVYTRPSYLPGRPSSRSVVERETKRETVVIRVYRRNTPHQIQECALSGRTRNAWPVVTRVRSVLTAGFDSENSRPAVKTTDRRTRREFRSSTQSGLLDIRRAFASIQTTCVFTNTETIQI